MIIRSKAPFRLEFAGGGPMFPRLPMTTVEWCSIRLLTIMRIV